MAFEELKKVLENNGFTVSVFATGEAAADYLDKSLDKKTIGMGGSMSTVQMGLYERLSQHNLVFRHGATPADAGEVQRLAATAEVYILSANGIAEDTGEIVNIDGNGNRVASSLYGHKKVYFIAGKNKISPDLHSAIHRVRNVVAPKNAQRLGCKTPCAEKADRCYNCSSPDRICRGLVVHYQKMRSMEMEVVLVEEDLGY